MSLQADWDAAVPVGVKPGGDLASQWEQATPVKIPTKSAAAPKEENPRSAKNLVGAAIEPGMSLASGAVAGPASGLAGIAGAVLPGPPGQGARWAENVGQGLTYQPRTTGGRNAMEAISYPFRKVSEGANAAGERIADATGSPALGAGVNTAIQSIPQLVGAKGAQLLKKPPAPKLDPDVKTLIDRGVKVTPGQIVPKLKRAEEAAQSIPFAGDFVKDAHGRAVESFNRAGWNDALKAAGEKEMPATVKTGNQASAYVKERLGDRYEELLGKMVGRLDNAPPKNALPAPGQLGQPPRPSLRQELDQLLALAKQDGGLPPREMRQLRRIVDKEIKAKFDKNGAAPGDTLKAIQETLRKEEGEFRTGGPYERKLADAIKEADAAVRRMVREANPKHAAELDKIDAGYARFKIAQRAAGSVGNQEGVVKPSAYDRSVRTSDRSKDHARYSEGKALQQDLSGAGKRVLSDTLPDSGTPFRISLMHALTNPKALAAMGLAGIPTAMLYSPMGIQLMQRMLTRPPAAGRAGAIAAPIGAAQYGQLPPPPQ